MAPGARPALRAGIDSSYTPTAGGNRGPARRHGNQRVGRDGGTTELVSHPQARESAVTRVCVADPAHVPEARESAAVRGREAEAVQVPPASAGISGLPASSSATRPSPSSCRYGNQRSWPMASILLNRPSRSTGISGRELASPRLIREPILPSCPQVRESAAPRRADPHRLVVAIAARAQQCGHAPPACCPPRCSPRTYGNQWVSSQPVRARRRSAPHACGRQAPPVRPSHAYGVSNGGPLQAADPCVLHMALAQAREAAEGAGRGESAGGGRSLDGLVPVRPALTGISGWPL